MTIKDPPGYVLTALIFGALLAGLVLLTLKVRRDFSTPSPEKIVSTEPVPALKLQKLISTGMGVSRGLYKVQIEGQTFLMVVDRDGVALVKYIPKADTQEQD